MTPLDRRTALRGMGTAIALPWLEVMTPHSLTATAATGIVSPPRRAAFFFIPNGVDPAQWLPTEPGANYEMPELLKPLEKHRDRFSIITGLAHHNAKGLGDGPGDHARSAACFLTGAHPVKTAGDDIQVGTSIDQIIAHHLRHETRFPSLELGCEPARQSGSCDSGYSCAYSGNISWRTPRCPTSKEINPRHVFERLFGGGRRQESTAAHATRMATRRSVLDFVRGDARRLSQELGVNDQRRLDEYLDGVRDLERRIEFVESSERDPAHQLGMEIPAGIPNEYTEHVRLMGDLMVLAFRLDLTRCISFMFANEGSNRSFPVLGVGEGHHHLSHHKGDADQIAKIKKINRYQAALLGDFLSKMEDTPEGDGQTLLDHSMILFGAAIGDGNRHNHDNLPIILAGGGGGFHTPGRHIALSQQTPLCNLHLAMASGMGVDADRFGDSTGVLPLGGG